MAKLEKQIEGYKISIYLTDVTPAMASEILAKYNTKNRRENAHHTTALVRNMVEGTWRFNGDTICFDDKGTLIDGQHRLSAIANSGKTITCLFVVGLNPDTIKTKDIEVKPRNLHDLLKMDDVKEYNNTATSIQRYFALRAGRIAMGVGSDGIGHLNLYATMDTKYSFYYEHRPLCDEAVAYARGLYRQNRLLTPGDIGGMFLYLYVIKHHSEDEIKGFFDGLVFQSSCNVVNILRNKLVIDKGAVKKMSGSFKQALIAKTWNYYIKGKDVKVLAYNPTTEGTIDFI